MADSIIDLADKNYRASWKTIVSAAPNNEIIHQDNEHPGLQIVCSGTSLSLFNVAFIDRPLKDANGAIERAIAYFRQKNLPGLICIRDGLDPSVDEAARKNGLKLAPPHPGMVLHPIVIANNDSDHTIEGLEITKVKSDDDIDKFSMVAGEAFKMPSGVARDLTSQYTLRQPGVTYFLGSIGGKPVATCSLIQTENVAGIYWVTTHEDYRRHGIATAMCTAALKKGVEDGCDVANLQASDMGKLVYERIGFRVLLPYNNYEVSLNM